MNFGKRISPLCLKGSERADPTGTLAAPLASLTGGKRSDAQTGRGDAIPAGSAAPPARPASAKFDWARNTAALLIFSSLVASCTATLKQKKRCEALDLQQEGYREALAGSPPALFDSYYKQCASVGAVLSRESYDKGRSLGLKAFCVQKNGYSLGLKGADYKKICPSALEKKFLIGYEKGSLQCLLNQGKEDAARGAHSSYDQSPCFKKSPSAKKSYDKGYKQGLKIFCSYENGRALGLKGAEGAEICPPLLAKRFSKGYAKGASECFFNQGRNDALNGRVCRFDRVRLCPKKASLGKQPYNKGCQAGLKTFCTYRSGYNFGLSGGEYKETCPQKTAEVFFKGFSLGMKEYREQKRAEEMMAIERERIAAEARARERELEIQRERLQAERERTRALERQRDRIMRMQEKREAKALELSEEALRLEKIRASGRQTCEWDSDCPKGSHCRHRSDLDARVCIPLPY